MAMPPDDPPPGVPEWIVTYGDMMSLLLTFFIMLVSMSEMKTEGKMRAMMDSLRESFGMEPEMASGVPGKSLQESGIFTHGASKGDQSKGGTERGEAGSNGLGGPSRTVKRINHGTMVTLGGSSVFAIDSAELTDSLHGDLDALAKALFPRPQKIVIRGHCGRRPRDRQAETGDAWSLSYERAQAAANYLMSKGIPRDRILISAAGDSEPVVVTRDREAQRQNHRIDVFVIDSYTTQAP